MWRQTARPAENLIKPPRSRKAGFSAAPPYKGSTPRNGTRTFSIRNVLPAAEREELPFDVIQILSFGSFFRGKESPTDVDPVLRVACHPARFTLFHELIEKLRLTPHYEEAFATPREALLHVCATEASATKWPARQRERFTTMHSHWLDGYTWNMLQSQD